MYDFAPVDPTIEQFSLSGAFKTLKTGATSVFRSSKKLVPNVGGKLDDVFVFGKSVAKNADDAAVLARSMASRASDIALASKSTLAKSAAAKAAELAEQASKAALRAGKTSGDEAVMLMKQAQKLTDEAALAANQAAKYAGTSLVPPSSTIGKATKALAPTADSTLIKVGKQGAANFSTAVKKVGSYIAANPKVTIAALTTAGVGIAAATAAVQKQGKDLTITAIANDTQTGGIRISYTPPLRLNLTDQVVITNTSCLPEIDDVHQPIRIISDNQIVIPGTIRQCSSVAKGSMTINTGFFDEVGNIVTNAAGSIVRPAVSSAANITGQAFDATGLFKGGTSITVILIVMILVFISTLLLIIKLS